MAILYGISPVDLIPDIPVVGWIDDFIITASGGLNFLQRYCERTDSSLTSIVKFMKWTVIGLGIIIILVVALLATLIVKLFVLSDSIRQNGRKEIG